MAIQPDKGIYLQLNNVQWQLLRQLLLLVFVATPVDGYEIESFVLAEMYREQLDKLTFYEPDNSGKMPFNLQYSQAYALTIFWNGKSQMYNTFLRPMIEPYLPMHRDFNYDDDQLNIEIDN